MFVVYKYANIQIYKYKHRIYIYPGWSMFDIGNPEDSYLVLIN